MTYAIIVAPEAVKQLRALKAKVFREVRDGMKVHLRHEPMKASKSRIKRLRGIRQPQFRLRIGEIRVFYDVEPTEVHVLAVVTKEQAEAWLKEKGVPSEEGGAGEG